MQRWQWYALYTLKSSLDSSPYFRDWAALVEFLSLAKPGTITGFSSFRGG
jgi:hypothetical protein